MGTDWITTMRRPRGFVINTIMFVFGLVLAASMAGIAVAGEDLPPRLFAAVAAIWLTFTLGRIAVRWWQGAAGRRAAAQSRSVRPRRVS